MIKVEWDWKLYIPLLDGIVTNLLNLVSIHGFSGADGFQSNSNPIWHSSSGERRQILPKIGKMVSKENFALIVSDKFL